MEKYLDIDFSKIEGYSRLTDEAKKALENKYKIHNSSIGLDYKEDYTPVKVEENNEQLEVHFKNGVWLHYMPDGTWY